jgi:probable rRNA maturation factor
VPKIYIVNRQKDLEITTERRKAIRAAVNYVLESEKKSCQELSFFFISDKAMCALHEEFFQDPSPTDCISFPMEEDTYLGDVFVCPKTAIRYANRHKKEVWHEVLLYVIHGTLHLLGYDDIEPKKRKIMRQKERIYISKYISKVSIT